MAVHYNRQAAVEYARRWALSTNAKYGRMEPDCANFVSQTLHEAGWPMIGSHNALYRARPNEWWFGGSLLTRASYSWGGAHNLHEFIRQSRRGTQVSSIDDLSPGDVVLWQRPETHRVWHATIVTGKQNGDLLLSYHTTDRLDHPLSKTGVAPKAWVLWKLSDVLPETRREPLSPTRERWGVR